jgi:hypothetical protein
VDLTVVSFFTPGRYAKYAKRLAASCDAAGVPCCIREVADRGTWIENNNYKPRFIRDMVEKFASPLLWIDADGELLARPKLLETTIAEFAIHGVDRRRRRWQPIGRREFFELPEDWPHGTKWFLTGTVYVTPTPGCVSMLDAWCGLAAAEPRGYGQHQVMEAWMAAKPETLMLPQTYCQIRRRTADTVVRHDLASTDDKGAVRA